MTHLISHGDALLTLRDMPSNHFHGSLCDPPYGLSFMGHGWDHGVPSAEVWREVLRVLRPGSHLLAFGGTRTYHRLTCAIEDAGFEIRDCMMWLYGSGFPKSHDVSKAIDKAAGVAPTIIGSRVLTGSAALSTDEKGGTYASNTSSAGRSKTVDVTRATSDEAKAWEGCGTALKPAWEPILVARKPLDGTVAANVQRWGCGGLAIDACRVGTHDALVRPPVMRAKQNTIGAGLGAGSQIEPLGRWPANVIFDEEAGAALDEQSGERKTSKPGQVVRRTKKAADIYGDHTADIGREQVAYGDTGGASRFFYCAKASRAERDAGSTEGGRNIHPTVKPLALARYLARLILPPIPDARMVVPFCGSGSEMIGALQAGWAHVEGVDSWDVAVETARERLAHHEGIFGRVA